jgi:hypothetical protein
VTFLTLTSLPTAASDWVAAGFGVAGVIIGAAITTYGTIWVQKEGVKREREADVVVHNTTVSILRGSLRQIGSFLRALSVKGVWRVPLDEEWLAAWQERGRVLAGFVDGQTYETVSDAFLVARLLRWQSTKQGEELSDGDRRLIDTWLERIEQGLEALDALEPTVTAS